MYSHDTLVERSKAATGIALHSTGEAEEASEMEQDSDAEEDAINSLLQAARCDIMRCAT